MSVRITCISTGMNGPRPPSGSASSTTRRPIAFTRPLYQRPASKSVCSAGAMSATSAGPIVTSRSRMQSR